MHRFLIGASAPGEIVRLPDEEALHARRVLRLKAGEPIELLDGMGAVYQAVLVKVGDEVLAEIRSKADGITSSVRLTLYQGLPKFEKLDMIVQKAAELGASRLVPVKMERSVVRLDEKEGRKRRDRLEKISTEAMKQCGRADRMEVAEPVRFSDAVAMFSREELMLTPWEMTRDRSLRHVHAQNPAARSVGILVGPEGGITRAEAEAAAEAGALLITLGPRILRAETAAIAIMAMTMHLWGDL